ncbi:MAG: hypothetical protein JW940_31895 [Polyangiaceae bacterium]|nr:hypothetical protein [Polyangiaceae bacterium]
MGSLTDKHIEKWLGGYVRHLGRRMRGPRPSGLQHLLFALCDHYEPLWGGADVHTGERRVLRWLRDYARVFEGFRDADGRMPQHSWFFPGEEYRPEYLDCLRTLVSRRCGEVEVHLHHDRDTASGLRGKLLRYLATFAEHGHLCRDADGRIRYAFIHGNWALANGRPEGTWCGVDDELPVLFETGCFADFTFPSCPDTSQSNMVNCIYWPTGLLGRRRAYETGELARVGEHYDDRILMITGPLSIASRPGSLRPRLEYGAVTAHDPPTAARVRSWAAQRIGVLGQPEWVFVKVYTHGASEQQADSIFGRGGHALHEALTQQFNDGVRWRLHYVTAREMFNLARAAMDGRVGDPNDYRDYIHPAPPARGAGSADHR